MISGLSMQAMTCRDARIPRAQDALEREIFTAPPHWLTGFDIDPEHAFETLGPRHGAVFAFAGYEFARHHEFLDDRRQRLSSDVEGGLLFGVGVRAELPRSPSPTSAF